jgi:DNA-binding CsgD family transcriptional regulator
MRADRRHLPPSSVLVPRPWLLVDDCGASVDRAEADSYAGGADGFEDPFVGRAEELAVLGSVTHEVRRGRPQVVRIEGPAGIGKTALVERFLQGQSDMHVLRCAGEPEEALVDFGVIDQLFIGAGLTSARLRVGGDSGLPHVEPDVVGGQILTYLNEHEAKGPVVLLVDDLQWADPESLRALLFALRRVAAERVLTLLLTRNEVAGPAEGLCRLAARGAGAVLHLAPLTVRDVRSLASSVAAGPFTTGLMAQLHAHTLGNPSHLRDVLAELPPSEWCTSQSALPVPRAVAQRVRHVVGVCAPEARRLVEAASVLGDGSRLVTAAALAGVEDPLATIEVASAVGLLDTRDEREGRHVVFPHPLVQAAVYQRLGPARRVRLHLAAAELVDEEGARLRHRVVAADPPDEGLAEELSGFAQRQAALGAWSGAASALVEASRMSPSRQRREDRLLEALDNMIASGDLVQASAFAREIAGFAPGPHRDAALGYLAILHGKPREAEMRLRSAWQQCDAGADRRVAAVVALRWALHSVGRLRGADVVDWAQRSIELAPPGDAARIEAEALLGLGLGWSGGLDEGIEAYESVLARTTDIPQENAAVGRILMPLGWLRLVAGDVPGSRSILAEAAPSQLRLGSMRIAVWSFVWLSRAEFLAGSWDESGVAAARAVALLEETGHEWLRPLARWAAVGVPAARGEWVAAEEHARLASSQGGDYELMVVAAGMARAQVDAARGDHEGVLRALEPVLEIQPREGVDEPGFWPWQGLYGDALVSAGRLEEAEAFLGPHEELAALRGRRLSVAMLARVRGRLESAAGRAEAAEEAFGLGLAQLVGLSVPFPQALLELAYGQVLRRHGHRRAAAERLEAARDRFAGLGAGPYVERCERELSVSGLAPAKRHDFDPSRLTAQELAVARLVARGLSNRQVAAELFVSVKTVQYHLTRIYSKLHVRSRTELAATYVATEPA